MSLVRWQRNILQRQQAEVRWPVAHMLFYSVTDLAIINSWVLYKETSRSKSSRREYMQRVAEELCGTSRNNQSDELAEREQEPPTKKAKDILYFQMPQQNDTDTLHL